MKKNKKYEPLNCTRILVQMESPVLAGSIAGEKIEAGDVEVEDFEDATSSGGFDVDYNF